MTSSKNTIVYIHCSAGFDRTGLVSGAYRMTYLDISYQQVMDENMNVIRPTRNHMHFNAFNGLQWYCMSIRDQEECVWNDKWINILITLKIKKSVFMNEECLLCIFAMMAAITIILLEWSSNTSLKRWVRWSLEAQASPSILITCSKWV